MLLISLWEISRLRLDTSFPAILDGSYLIFLYIRVQDKEGKFAIMRSINAGLFPTPPGGVFMEKEKKLKLMQFWLFGTFIIIWAAASVYLGVAVGLGTLIFMEIEFWIAFVGTAVLCVLWYFIYKWYLDRLAK